MSVMKHKGLVSSLAVMFLWGALFPLVKLGYRFFDIASTGDILAFAGISQLFGGIVLLAVGTAAGGDPAKLIPTSWQVLGVFCLIVTASVISYCLWFTVVKKEALSKLFIIKFAEPLFASVFSWLLLGEDIFKPSYLLAFLLISAGIVIANSKKK